jgi:putative pyruvate formate lyase activating enzyme
MSPLLNSKEILLRAEEAHRLLHACCLCPRECGIDRTKGEHGFCGMGPDLKIAAALGHFGEEPPLSGEGGAGTIFFSGCNLKCIYCQNHQISHDLFGSFISSEDLADKMIKLQLQGCECIDAVSPTHQIPEILESLAIAVEKGLKLPLVWNSNAYERIEVLELLDGIVDIYLPDLKYAADSLAHKFSGVEDYVKTARTAITKMHRQVGNLQCDEYGKATRGIIVRHLILPNGLSGPKETLTWLRENFSDEIFISLMSQYSPLHLATNGNLLDRKITQKEYDDVVDFAWELGLENCFVQDFESQELGIPDFTKSDPFNWKMEPVS